MANLDELLEQLEQKEYDIVFQTIKIEVTNLIQKIYKNILKFKAPIEYATLFTDVDNEIQAYVLNLDKEQYESSIKDAKNIAKRLVDDILANYEPSIIEETSIDED